jgi:hypothetical protein
MKKQGFDPLGQGPDVLAKLPGGPKLRAMPG